MLSGILVIKCPANRGLVTSRGLRVHLITNIPQRMRSVCNNIFAEGKKQYIGCFCLARSLYRNGQWLEYSKLCIYFVIRLIYWWGTFRTKYLHPCTWGNTSFNVPVETKETEATVLFGELCTHTSHSWKFWLTRILSLRGPNWDVLSFVLNFTTQMTEYLNFFPAD